MLTKRWFRARWNTPSPALTRTAARMAAGRWNPLEEEKTDNAALSLSQRMNQFREAFLSALDGHSTDRIAAYIKENYLENEK